MYFHLVSLLITTLTLSHPHPNKTNVSNPCGSTPSFLFFWGRGEGFDEQEAAVHYELGRLLKKMGDVDGTLRNFSIALNLDPKARIYKKALESLDTISEEGEEQQ